MFTRDRFGHFCIENLYHFTLGGPNAQLEICETERSDQTEPRSRTGVKALLSPRAALASLESQVKVGPRFKLPRIVDKLSIRVLSD